MHQVINRAMDVKKPHKTRATLSERLLYPLAVLSGLGLIGTLFAAILIIFVFTAFSSTLPSPTRLTNRSIEQSTKIFDRNNKPLYSVYEEKNRTLVTLDQVSPYLINAILATEDADFYKHEGIDPLGMARGILITLFRTGKQGGSTITQQVAKNALLTPERTVVRKIKDMVLALQIERSYNKNEILQMYINEVPCGGTNYGFQECSNAFFGVNTAELSLAEAALLAGLPQAPTRYSPHTDSEAAKNRQRYVLWLMKTRGWFDENGQQHYLSEEEYNAAIEDPLAYIPISGEINAPHFVMYVLKILRERYGDDVVQNGGLKVKTSLDLNLQNEFQKYVFEEVEKGKDSYGFTNAGLVAIDPKTHEILAMVGSKDYFSEEVDGQFNVTTGMRQPGSALKPITYLTGLTQGYTASTVLYDVYTKFETGEGQPPYDPENYGNWGFRGPMQVRYALANSVNVAAVKMLDLVGIPNMVKMANDLGIKSFYYDPSKHGLALTLGGGEVPLLELTNAFATLGAGGVYKDLAPILEVKDYNQKVLETRSGFLGQQVVDENLVWIITDILSDNSARSQAFGTGSMLNIPGSKVAVKTGTSNDLKDNWTIGFTRDIAIGVWVGNNDGTQMNNRLASGLTGAAPIWNKAIKYYLADHPHQEFPKPDGVVDTWVGTLSGMVPYEDKEERRAEYFLSGTEPKAKSEMFQRVKICDDGNIKDKTYVVYKAQKEEWQTYVDQWVKNRYKDDEDELFIHLGPEYEKEEKPDRFDLDNCQKDDD